MAPAKQCHDGSASTAWEKNPLYPPLAMWMLNSRLGFARDVIVFKRPSPPKSRYWIACALTAMLSVPVPMYAVDFPLIPFMVPVASL